MAPKPIDVTIRGNDQTKGAFDSAAKNAEGFGGRLKGLVTGPLNAVSATVVGLAAQIGERLIDSIADFAKESVEAAANADAALGRVQQAVENTGVSFSGVRGDLDALFQKIQETTRYSHDDAASAFANLVNVSGNYAGSVKNLSLVADLAAAKQLDLNTASELVGRVMAGNTSMLKRYGIVVKDGADAMQTLREKFSGFAERDAGTLEGRIHSIANAWEDVKEAIGRALTGDTGLTSASGALVSVLNRFGEWIDSNRGGLHEYIDGLQGIIERLKQLPALFERVSQNPVFGFFIGKPVGAAFSLGKRVVGGALGGYDKLFSLLADKTGGVGDLSDGSDDPGYIAAMKTINDRKHAASLRQIDANARKSAADAAKQKADEQAKADQKHLADLKAEYDLLQKTTALTGATLADYQKMAAIEAEMNRIARNPNASAANRSAAIDFVSSLAEKIRTTAQREADALEKLDKAGVSIGALQAKGVHTIGENGDNQITARATASPIPVTAGMSAGQRFASGAALSFADAFGGPDAFKGVDTSLGKLEDHMAAFTGSTLGNFFSTWQQGINDVITGHEKLGAAMLMSARKAVGGAMAAEAQRTLFQAAAAAAAGFTNPTEFVTAARLFAVGTAELAAAAALSGGGSGSSGGYGGAVSASGLQQNQGSGGGKATIILKGNGINFRNPDELAALRDAILELGTTRDLEFVVQGG